MKKNILKNASIGIGLGMALLPLLALAQIGGVPGPIITNLNNISNLITTVMNWIVGIIFTIAVIMLLFSAFLYLTAGGSEDRVGKAKGYLIYAIVGIVVALLTFSIRPFIENFLRQSS